MALTGQRLIASAGTAAALVEAPAGLLNGPVMIKALPSNTGLVGVGFGAGALLSSGFLLAAGEALVLEFVARLDGLYVDAAVDGDGVCWIGLGV